MSKSQNQKKAKPYGPLSKFKDEFCQKAIELSKEGKTMEMIAEALDIHKDTLYEWAKVHPNFSDALKRCKQNQLQFMQRIGLKGMSGQFKGFGQAAWIFWMKAQFGWRDGGEFDFQEETELEFI